MEPDIVDSFRIITCDDGTFAIVPPGCDANQLEDDDWQDVEGGIAVAEDSAGRPYFAVAQSGVVSSMLPGTVYSLGDSVPAEIENWDGPGEEGSAADEEEDEEEEEEEEEEDEDEVIDVEEDEEDEEDEEEDEDEEDEAYANGAEVR